MVICDVAKGVYGRVLVINGCTFSPNYHQHMLDEFNNLLFAYSPPSNNQLIRISGSDPGLYFILGQKWHLMRVANFLELRRTCA